MKKNPNRVKKILTEEVSLKRFGSPDEIGNLVTFLASPVSSFITGQIIIADGGQVR